MRYGMAGRKKKGLRMAMRSPFNLIRWLMT
jgi:hypothetical protein